MENRNTQRQRIRQLLWLVSILVVVSVTLGGYWLYKVTETLSSQARLETQRLKELENTFTHLSRELALQTQEWKDMLLRSNEPAVSEQHHQAFLLHAQLFHNQLSLARNILYSAGLDISGIQEIERYEDAMLLKYQAAFKLLNPRQPLTFREVDQQVRGLDRKLLFLLDHEVERLDRALDVRLAAVNPNKESAEILSNYQIGLGLLALLLPIGALGAFFLAFRELRMIAHSDSRFRTIYQSIGDAMLVTDSKGVVESINQSAQQLTGWTDDEARGKPLHEVFQTFNVRSRKPVEAAASVVLRTGSPLPVTNGIMLRRRDGSEVVIEESATPIQSHSGHTFGVVMAFRDLTQRQAMLQELEQQRVLFQQTFDQAGVGMAHLGIDGRWLRVNRKLCEITGYTEPELLALSFMGITHPDDVGRDLEQLNLLLRQHLESYYTEKRYLHKSGKFVWVSVTVSIVWKPDNTPDYGVSIIEDIQARKMAEKEAAAARQQYQMLFEQMPQGVVLLDENMQIIAHNHEAMRQLEYSNAELLQKHLRDFKPDAAMDDEERQFAQIRETGRADYETQYLSHSGKLMDMDVSVVMVQLPDGRDAYQVVFNDITEQKLAASQIEYLAYHDQLTGLPNRRLLHDRLTQAISSALRNDNKLAVIYLDLDNFKDVNDSLGHQTGDILLKAVASRLQKCIRAEDTLARMGGDEFVIMLNHLTSMEDAATFSEKLLLEVLQPMYISGNELRISSSIGISLFPQDGRESDDLLKHADTALYQAKNAGRSTYRYYTQALHAQSLARLKMERLMPHALEKRQFELYFQPQVDLRDNMIVGCEALIRWHQPDMGLIMPVDFIPIAEHSHLINKIGLWVMREACLQAKRWQNQGLHIQISFNVSARQFMQPGEFVDSLRVVLEETAVDPSLLTIELTESMLLFSHSSDDVLREICALGIRIALDDFGTGYSSLSYLRLLPIHHLKIDQSFVSNVERNKSDAEMVKTIIGMAHNLNMSVVAEGVENAEQASLLKELNCEIAQGYHFSKPIPAAEFEALLRQQGKP